MTEAAGTIRSMTGFAAFTGAAGGWRFTGDIKSVNGRGLDVRLRLPDWIEGLEQAVRERVRAKIARGSVTVSVRATRDETQADMSLNEAQLGSALSLLAEIENQASEKGLTLAPMQATDIAAIRGVIEARDTEDRKAIKALATAILEAVDGALQDFDDNRAQEGAALLAVLNEQIQHIDDLTKAAEEAAGDRAAAARAVLKRNLARVMEATDVPDEARLTQELAILAVKSDVTEELDRLHAHVAAARGYLGADEPIGRKLDFLMQEFNREANTLCSKSQSAALTAVGLDLKAVIDQMREQVQNIE